MTRQVLATLAFLPALFLAPAVGRPQAKPSGVAADVLAAQDRRFALTIEADVAGLDAMMTDDLTYTHSSAVTETKAALLEALRSGKHVYREIQPRDRQVRVWGDAAAVTGWAHIVIEPGGKRSEVDLYFTELYVRQGGRWKMALWQSTRPPAPVAPAK
jgi:ketosteroid isomerase-like protein